jgi:hypothetical protein
VSLARHHHHRVPTNVNLNKYTHTHTGKVRAAVLLHGARRERWMPPPPPPHREKWVPICPQLRPQPPNQKVMRVTWNTAKYHAKPCQSRPQPWTIIAAAANSTSLPLHIRFGGSCFSHPPGCLLENVGTHEYSDQPIFLHSANSDSRTIFLNGWKWAYFLTWKFVHLNLQYFRIFRFKKLWIIYMYRYLVTKYSWHMAKFRLKVKVLVVLHDFAWFWHSTMGGIQSLEEIRDNRFQC